MFKYTNAKNQTFLLYSKDITLKTGKVVTIYCFVREEWKKGTPLESIPKGYEVYETERSKMPLLRKIK